MPRLHHRRGSMFLRASPLPQTTRVTPGRKIKPEALPEKTGRENLLPSMCCAANTSEPVCRQSERVRGEPKKGTLSARSLTALVFAIGTVCRRARQVLVEVILPAVKGVDQQPRIWKRTAIRPQVTPKRRAVKASVQLVHVQSRREEGVGGGWQWQRWRSGRWR